MRDMRDVEHRPGMVIDMHVVERGNRNRAYLADSVTKLTQGRRSLA
jgi:hypothetical protein